MDRLSDLERAVVAAGASLNASEFGKAMRLRHPGRRVGPDQPGTELDRFELNAGPAVYRTFIVLDASDRTHMDLHLSDMEREYVSWVRDVQAALKAIADRFWGTIRPDVRLLVYDHDSVQVLHSGPPYIPGLRSRPGPSLQTSCLRVGIGPQQLAALAGCWHAAHATPCYTSAQAATTRIRLYDRLRRDLISARDSAHEQTQAAFSGQRRLGEVARALNEIADNAYSATPVLAREAADAIRGYHELIQVVLWALLGLTEQPQDRERSLDGGLPRVSVEHRWRHLQAQFTTGRDQSSFFPETSAPFLVQGRGPLDGVYICTEYTLRGFGEGGYVDLKGHLLREFERAPLSAR